MWFIFNQDKKQTKVELKQALNHYLNENKKPMIEDIESIKAQGQALPNLDKELNATIRIWLPNIIYKAIESYTRLTVAGAIRDLLIKHCYGEIATREMRNKAYERPRFKFSISLPNTVTNIEMFLLGKSNTPTKIACNQKLKDDLEKLATLHNLTLSEYIRNVLIKHFLGSGFVTRLDLAEDNEEFPEDQD